MAHLENAIRFLVKLGLLDVVLPFLLTFVLVYALLQKSRLLGEEDGKPKKRINIIAALVAGLLFVNFIRYTDFVTWFMFIVLVIVAIVAVLLFTNLLGVDIKLTAWIIVPALVFFIVLFTYSFIDYSVLLEALLHPFTVFIAVVAIGLYFVVREPGKRLTDEEKRKREEERKRREEEGKRKGKKDEKRKGEEKEPEYRLREVERVPAEEEFHKGYRTLKG